MNSEPDIHGTPRAMLHLLEAEPLTANMIFHRWRKPRMSRRKTKCWINRLLHELRDMGFTEVQGGLWDSTELGRRALANARARKLEEPAHDHEPTAA